MKNKKIRTHEKVSRARIRKTVDALTQITTADPVAFLISVMQGKPFRASHPENPSKQTLQYPTREQRVLVGMYLASRIMPVAKGQAPAAGNVNVVIRSRHANEPRPANLPARFSQEIIDATPSEGPLPATLSRDREGPEADTGAEITLQVSRYQKESSEA